MVHICGLQIWRGVRLRINSQRQRIPHPCLSFSFLFLPFPPHLQLHKGLVGGRQGRSIRSLSLFSADLLQSERPLEEDPPPTSPQPTVASYTETLHVSRSCCLGTTSSGHTTHAQPPPSENQPGNNLGRFPQRHNQNLSDETTAGSQIAILVGSIRTCTVNQSFLFHISVGWKIPYWVQSHQARGSLLQYLGYFGKPLTSCMSCDQPIWKVGV